MPGKIDLKKLKTVSIKDRSGKVSIGSFSRPGLMPAGSREYLDSVIPSVNYGVDFKDLIERLGVGKQEAVVVGDTEHDYEVARAMNADCILIANGHQSKTRLQAPGVPVLDDVRSLVH